MKWRERWASILLWIGASLWVVALFLVIPSRRGSGLRRFRFNPTLWKAAGVLALIGGIFVLGGIVAIAIIHLTRRWGLRRVYPGATITARFYTNRQGEMIVYPMGYAPSELCYYVRLRFPDGQGEEFECTPALFQQLREGMEGTAVCKGNCLLAFYPVSASAQRRG